MEKMRGQYFSKYQHFDNPTNKKIGPIIFPGLNPKEVNKKVAKGLSQKIKKAHQKVESSLKPRVVTKNLTK